MTPAPVKAAARERSLRTFLQGLGVDLLIAVAVVVLAQVPGADLSSGAAWIALSLAVGKSVLMAAASYVMRLKLKPSEETATAGLEVETL